MAARSSNVEALYKLEAARMVNVSPTSARSKAVRHAQCQHRMNVAFSPLSQRCHVTTCQGRATQAHWIGRSVQGASARFLKRQIARVRKLFGGRVSRFCGRAKGTGRIAVAIE